MEKNVFLPGLLEEEFISCYPSLAKRAGVNRALILQKLHYLTVITEKAKRQENFIAGRWWVYNTYEQWQADHFPWLSVATVKRLFQDLERQGIVLSYTPPENSQKKYYTICRERWAVWFAQKADLNDPIPRIKMIRVADQNDLGVGSKRDGLADQNDPGPGSKESDPSIYIDSVTTSNLLSETTPTTTAVSADLDSEAKAVVVDDEPMGESENPEWKLIQKDLAALHLTPVADKALRALGPLRALAVALACDRPGVDRPPGGLAVWLTRDPTRIAVSLLDQAESLLKMRALCRPDLFPREQPEPDTLAAREQACAQFQATARAIAVASESEDQMPFATFSEPRDPLDRVEVTTPEPPKSGPEPAPTRAAPVDVLAEWRARWARLREEFGAEVIPRTAVPHAYVDGVLVVYADSHNAKGHDPAWAGLLERAPEFAAWLKEVAGCEVQVAFESIQAAMQGVGS